MLLEPVHLPLRVRPQEVSAKVSRCNQGVHMPVHAKKFANCACRGSASCQGL